MLAHLIEPCRHEVRPAHHHAIAACGRSARDTHAWTNNAAAQMPECMMTPFEPSPDRVAVAVEKEDHRGGGVACTIVASPRYTKTRWGPNDLYMVEGRHQLAAAIAGSIVNHDHFIRAGY